MHRHSAVRYLVSSLRLASACLACVVVLAAAPAAAQAGRVTGTVKDADGRAMRGATITAQKLAAAGSVTAVTDDKGRFRLPDLQPGVWLFTAAAPGFVRAQAQADVSASRSTRPIDFRLRRAVAAGDLLPLDGVNSGELQAFLWAADQLVAAGRYDEAIAAYQTVRLKAPALTLVNLAIGEAYRKKKDPERALAAYREVLKTEPDNQPARAALASLALEQGDAAAAEEALRPVAANPAAGRDVLYTMGEVKRAQGARDEATAWYRKAADRDPAWAKPVLRLGEAAFDQGDLAGALAFMEKVLTLAPGSPEAAGARVFLDLHRK